MMPNTTSDNSTITATKISAVRGLMTNAKMVAPSTTHGERRNRRITQLMPVCMVLTSLVMRVISVAVPTVSSSE